MLKDEALDIGPTNPSFAIVWACSGPSTIKSWLWEKYQPTFDPSETAVSVMRVSV